MSFVQRIDAPDQELVVLAEDGDVAVLLFFGKTYTENFDHADAVVLLSVSEAERLAAALIEAVERTRAAA
jgi:hypothetical protein